MLTVITVNGTEPSPGCLLSTEFSVLYNLFGVYCISEQREKDRYTYFHFRRGKNFKMESCLLRIVE